MTSTSTQTTLHKGSSYVVAAPGAAAYSRKMTYIGRISGYLAFRPAGLTDTFFVLPEHRSLVSRG